MNDVFDQIISKDIQERVVPVFKHLVKNILLLVTAFVIAGLISYLSFRGVRPVYTATFVFVLSTDQAQSGLSSLASQLGFDGTTAGAGSIFSGDNIIELFKSRALIGTAINRLIDTGKKETLFTLIGNRIYKSWPENVRNLNGDVKSYTPRQLAFHRMIVSSVAGSFTVFKKDKKLIFYNITATGPDPDVAYYTAKCMLAEASKQFIETKTANVSAGIQLLTKQADSLSKVIRGLYSNSAALTDQTYNINPAYTRQRAPLPFNQVRVAAVTAAYTEVSRNLESSRIALQKETPLYKIIDEPELPLSGSKPSVLTHVMFRAIFGTLLMAVILVLDFIFAKKYS